MGNKKLIFKSLEELRVEDLKLMKSGQIPDNIRTFIQSRMNNQPGMNPNPTGIGIFGGQSQSLGGGLGANNNQFGNQNKQGAGLFSNLGANSGGGLTLGGQTAGGVLGMGNQQQNNQQGVSYKKLNS